MVNDKIKDILFKGSPAQVRELFAFDNNTEPLVIKKKFDIWARFFFPKYFQSGDAPFHTDGDVRRINLYKGINDKSFVHIGFRGCAKTTRAKLFRAYVIACDKDHKRKYLRILSKDIGNAKQSVTDIYNILISPRVRALYPEIFEKTDAKREETMASFTTSTGVKVIAETIGTDQRGNIQDEARPDFDWYDDFETRVSLYSAITTKKIWDNMEEAKNGLAKDGVSEYTCNYISERGNVHKLVMKIKNQLIVPIEKDGEPTWNRYTKEEIKKIKEEAEDYEGEYLCQPSASRDVYFDRDTLNSQEAKQPTQEIAGFKMFSRYRPDHRYGIGADIAGGVGLDSSCDVLIDFDTLPAQVVGIYRDNLIKPDIYGDELARHGDRFGQPIIAPENNKFDMCIGRLKQIYPNEKIFKMPQSDDKIRQGIKADFGWNTNTYSKPKMLAHLAKAIEDGQLQLNDKDLIQSLKSYTRDDLMDRDEDVRLTTRHFDDVIALCIAWQMKDYATITGESKEDAKTFLTDYD